MTDIDLSNLKEIVNVYKAAVSEITRWEKIRDDLNRTLKDVMADADIATVDGVPALRRTVARRSRFDTKLFREEFPELAEKYMIEGTVITLTIIKPKDVPAPDQQ
jgi:predicted phage-related endonuclease